MTTEIARANTCAARHLTVCSSSSGPDLGAYKRTRAESLPLDGLAEGLDHGGIPCFTESFIPHMLCIPLATDPEFL